MKWNISIHTLDVGAGDCCIVQLKGIPENDKEEECVQQILIDGGVSSQVDKIYRYLLGEQEMSNYISSAITIKPHFDYIVVSHFDEDHVGGIRELLADDNIMVLAHILGEQTVEMFEKFCSNIGKGFYDRMTQLWPIEYVYLSVYCVCVFVTGMGSVIDVFEYYLQEREKHDIIQIWSVPGLDEEQPEFLLCLIEYLESESLNKQIPRPIFLIDDIEFWRSISEAVFAAIDDILNEREIDPDEPIEGEDIFRFIQEDDDILLSRISDSVTAAFGKKYIKHDGAFKLPYLTYNCHIITPSYEVESEFKKYLFGYVERYNYVIDMRYCANMIKKYRTWNGISLSDYVIGSEMKIGEWIARDLLTMNFPEIPFMWPHMYLVTVDGIIRPEAYEIQHKNDSSVALLFTLGNFTYFTAGDLPGEIEDMLEAWIMNGVTGNISVIKVSHHGSAASTSEEFLDALKPSCALISCGNTNVHDHPNVNLLERLVESEPTKHVLMTGCINEKEYTSKLGVRQGVTQNETIVFVAGTFDSGSGSILTAYEYGSPEFIVCAIDNDANGEDQSGMVSFKIQV